VLEPARLTLAALFSLVAALLLVSSAPLAQAQSSGDPTTPILDDFNRANEDPLSQGGLWSTSVVGGGTWSPVHGGIGFGPIDRLPSLAGEAIVTEPITVAASRRGGTIPAGDAEVWGIVKNNVGSFESLGLYLHL
jgi:hypothetical protein